LICEFFWGGVNATKVLNFHDGLGNVAIEKARAHGMAWACKLPNSNEAHGIETKVLFEAHKLVIFCFRINYRKLSVAWKGIL
jgi:hypothetical protein